MGTKYLNSTNRGELVGLFSILRYIFHIGIFFCKISHLLPFFSSASTNQAILAIVHNSKLKYIPVFPVWPSWETLLHLFPLLAPSKKVDEVCVRTTLTVLRSISERPSRLSRRNLTVRPRSHYTGSAIYFHPIEIIKFLGICAHKQNYFLGEIFIHMDYCSSFIFFANVHTFLGN